MTDDQKQQYASLLFLHLVDNQYAIDGLISWMEQRLSDNQIELYKTLAVKAGSEPAHMDGIQSRS